MMHREKKADTQEILKKLELKYQAMGQDMDSYLDGLLHSNFLSYWDYIHLDTLLSLQNPRTDLPDEKIFIIYHQITELYFKLIRLEMEQLCSVDAKSPDKWKLRLERIINYLANLSRSFDIMVYGMEPLQFLKFRMALLPASGFQSAQYRILEFMSTSIDNLVDTTQRGNLSGKDINWKYDNIYWKSGNKELKSGEKTLTLAMFEKQYDKNFLETAVEYADTNIWSLYQNAGPEINKDEDILRLMKEFDIFSNIHWRLSHYKSAVRYLDRDPDAIKATGGTNWQKYLPPSFQRILFFPGLWNAEETKEWGKAWVMKLFKEQVEGQWHNKA